MLISGSGASLIRPEGDTIARPTTLCLCIKAGRTDPLCNCSAFTILLVTIIEANVSCLHANQHATNKQHQYKLAVKRTIV